MNYCSYYQALVAKPECWYVLGILRSFEHIAFDRTLDTAVNRVEFYVPESREQEFVQIMNYFQEKDLVSDLQKLPNRLMEPGSQL